MLKWLTTWYRMVEAKKIKNWEKIERSTRIRG
jgi:hypothetical protein